MKYQFRSIETKFLAILILCHVTVNTLAQEKKIFKIFPEIIGQGSMIQITYNPSLKGISPATAVKGSVYLFKDFKWQGSDLPLVKSDSGYTGTCTIPVGAAVLACRFSIGDSIDRGGRFPYVSLIHTGKKLSPGAYTEWGLLRSKAVDGTLSSLVSKEAWIEPKVLVQHWIFPEFNNTTIRRNLFFDIARGIKEYLPAKADSILRKSGYEITSLPDVTEKELISVEKVYRTILNDKPLADALKKTILTAYPKGLMKRLQIIKEIYLQTNMDMKIQQWNDFIKACPFTEFPYDDYVNPALGDRSFFTNAYTSVANITLLQKHDIDQVTKLVDSGPFDLINYFYDHYVVYPFRQQVSPITDKEALALSVSFTDVLLKRIEAANIADRGIFAPAEWTKQQMINNAGVWAHHAELLYKSGQYEAALKIADEVKPYLGYKFIDFNTTYVKLLDHFHKTAQATAYITAVIKADTASPEIIELLKDDWIKVHGGKSNDFDAYYETLRPGNKLKEMQARLKASMVHIPAVNFNLQNIKGQQIDLGQQKGKIVVLDFWASWCFPCKAAMPGMQTLVHKYQPCGDVAFFFIATLEESPNYKKLINDFLAEKKYDFNVLYDAENPETKKMGLTFDHYAKQLKLSGIPQKIIIDRNGFVRWVSGGFGGDLVALTDEVSTVIDILKNEKS